MNVLIAMAFSGAEGGAVGCMMNILDNLPDDVNPTVIVGSEYGMAELLKKRGIKYVVSPILGWMVRDDYSKLHMIISRARYYIQREYVLRKLIKQLSGLHFDVIHSNSSSIEYGATLARKLNIPHIWHIREFMEFYNWAPVLSKKSCERVFNSSKYVVTVSKALEENYKEKYSLNTIRTIYDGVEHFAPEREIVKFKEFTIIYSGGFQVNKGIWEAIYAYDKLSEMGRNPRIILVGASNSEVINYVKEKGYNNVEIRDYMPLSELRELRAKCHVALSCSAVEAFGRITAEAMDERTLVIASDRGANVNLINNRVNGLMYHYDDHRELAELIIEVMDNYELFVPLIDQAEIDYNNQYTDEVNADNIVRLYRKCVEENNSDN